MSTTDDHIPRVEHRSGGSNKWATPRALVPRVVSALGLPPVVLDLAAEASTAVAPRWYGPGGERADALSSEPWEAPAGLRFLQPPYSRQCTTCADWTWHKRSKALGVRGCAAMGHKSTTIDAWIARAIKSGTGPGGESSPILALLPASTGAAWFHRAMGSASRILFVRGRVKFLAPGPDGTLEAAATGAAFNSVVALWAGERRPGHALRVGAVDADGRRVTDGC